jgi:tyrosyl-tRNA synthetase
MAGGEAFALTTPLIKKADGTKFGKSEGGNIWLDPEKTSPYAFYQFWLNAADQDAVNYLKIFSLKTREEIESIIAIHEEAPHLRSLQRALAEEITARVHSQSELENALAASEILFGNATEEALRKLDEKTLLSMFEGVPQFSVPKNTLENGIDIVDFLAQETKVFSSKGEARKMTLGNGVSINKTKVTLEKKITTGDVLNGRYILAQKGKKNYYLIIID